MSALSRRQFLRRVALWGCGAVAADLLAACGPAAQPTPVPNATTASHTATPASQPTSTVDLQPTQAEPTAQPTLSPTPPAPTATATAQATPNPAYLIVARGGKPSELTERVVAALGGIERFVKQGANVIIKPNICIASHTFEYAATTNPEVVATLVRLCLGAGAKRVRVMDQPFSGTPDAAYARSGIAEAVRGAGGQMEIMTQMKFREVAIPEGRDIKKWRVYGEILDADVVINVPIAKTHGNTRLTLGSKNLMGIVEDRSSFHLNLNQRIADINSQIKPALTIIDAVRIMVRNGPTGGSLDDVKVMNTLIASPDVIAADAYATSLFGLKPTDIGYIKTGAEMKLGTMDLSSIKIEELQVG